MLQTFCIYLLSIHSLFAWPDAIPKLYEADVSRGSQFIGFDEPIWLRVKGKRVRWIVCFRLNDFFVKGLNVGIAIINLPFWDGLHHRFMVFSGVVYYCYTLITALLSICFCMKGLLKT